jgi:hypothetical protein
MASGKAAPKPPSVAEFERIYNQGRQRPSMGSKEDTVGLKSPHKIDQAPPGSDGDVAQGWFRGTAQATEYRCFDRSNPKGSSGPRNTASGADMTKSPFSAAHKTFKGD